VPLEGVAGRVAAMLDQMQSRLLERARAFRDERTSRVSTREEFDRLMEGRPGFVIAGWCGSADCEARIKAETQATIRNMPLDAPPPDGPCVCCGRPAAAQAWFAKAY
jgi:prolyl-tRNA synthetase